jgi:hypothetical protein
MDRIDKSAFRRGEYVGYADGVWRIKRREGGGWIAMCQRDPSERFLFARTLASMNAKLADYAAKRMATAA